MAECTHSRTWQEDMHGKTCLDCGFNTLHNDYGMYNNPETKGILTRIKEEMEKVKPKISFADFIWQQEFIKHINSINETNINAYMQRYNSECFLMPHHVYSKRKRLDFLFTQLNPEE